MTAPALPTVDPDLMALAWEILTERAERPARKRGMIDARQVAITAWFEFRDAAASDDDAEEVEISDAELNHDIAMIGVLARRLAALGSVLGRIEPGSYPVEALVEVAAVAPLADSGDRPQFQLLDFLSRAERAVAGTI